MKNFKPDKRLARLAPPADSRGPKGVARAAGLHQRTYHPLNAPPVALAGNALPLALETLHRRAWRVLVGCFWALERPARGGIGP